MADNITASFTDDGAIQISTNIDDSLVFSNVTNKPLEGLGITGGKVEISSSTSSFRSAKAIAFSLMRAKIDRLATNDLFAGVHIGLNTAPPTEFNEQSGTRSLTINGVRMDCEGLGIAAAVNDFQDTSDIVAAKSDIESALEILGDITLRLAACMSTPVAQKIYSADLENLVLASANSLELADLQAESANSLAAQTRGDLSGSRLSILNMPERSIRRLL